MVSAMALQDAILAALSNGESSGYDMAKAFDVTVANFWTASPQQLYRELDKMETAGLIEARMIQQLKRPNKRLFSLTDHGRATLRGFTIRAPKPAAIRDELLVQVESMDLADAASITVNVQNKLKASETKLKRYERTRSHLLDGRSERAYLAEADHLGPYLTLSRGITFEQENIRWCEFVLATLEDRTGAS
ncbi:DNA-binding transcriptional regulator, PadR family [Brevibacterium antiquum CNRZ 918]|uniref:DNA-binding transcriptional regulator, PadR family n=2 Tax=Brevibacteriaceae TaxID=85019 RepID=A0A2H1KZQ3_9MICO|nr:DNA-binding transcriptional regulator, PadR family [Brevibacterium antiquum CNRZ 918]